MPRGGVQPFFGMVLLYILWLAVSEAATADGAPVKNSRRSLRPTVPVVPIIASPQSTAVAATQNDHVAVTETNVTSTALSASIVHRGLSSFTCTYSASNTNSAQSNYVTCAITACPGDNLVMSGCDSSCSGDQYYRLFDNNNNQIAYSDESCGSCSQISYSVPTSQSGCVQDSLHLGCYSSNSCGGTVTVAGTGCQAGYYLSGSSCLICAAGSVTDTLASAGATTCTPCSAGSYSSTSTQACTSCPYGTTSVISGGVFCSITFSYTGSVQRWLVDAGVATFTVDAYGAEGGDYTYNGVTGGLGGYISVSNIAASSFVGQTLLIYVGGVGSQNAAPGLGGGGGVDYSNTLDYTSGGGATDLRTASSDLSSRLVVAGGGGGGGGHTGANGGAGGGNIGQAGGDYYAPNGWVGGGGGSQTAGGDGHTSTSPVYTSTYGTLGQGGDGVHFSGGGGGGYYGGGGGLLQSGGGGGSSYVNPSYTITTNSQGVQSGNGVLYITLVCQAGYYNAASSCLACGAGTTSSSGQTTCVQCVQGKYSPASGQASCLDCAAGTYNPSSGQSSCLTCAAGTYNPSTGSASSSACLTCVAGTYNPSSGSTSSSACLICAAGSVTDTLASAGATTCTPCSAGKYSSTSTQACTSCVAGTYNPSSGSTSVSACLACVAGTYNPSSGSTSSSACLACAAGTYNPSSVQDSCLSCVAGKYNPSSGSTSSSACLTCPSGLISPAGSSSVDFCISPASNFVAAFFALSLAMWFIIEFLYFGRFHRTAFLRRSRVVKKLSEQCKESFMALVVFATDNAAQIEASNSAFWKCIKGALFILLCFVLVPGVSLLLFSALIAQVFFKSMILWRGYQWGALSFFSVIFKAVENLKQILHFDIPFINEITTLFSVLSNFRVDLKAVNITCEGSIAPINLLLNIVILGAVTIFIESDAVVFMAIGFNNLTSKFAQVALLPSYRELILPGKKFINYFKYFRVLLSVIFVEAIGALNVPQSTLQYLMGFVEFKAFTQDHRAAHAATHTCDIIVGVPNIDSFFAVFSTLLAWLLIAPSIYEIARILYPRIPAEIRDNLGLQSIDEAITADKKRWSFMDDTKRFFTYLAPDMWLATLAQSWTSTVKSLSTAESAQRLDCKPCLEPCLSSKQNNLFSEFLREEIDANGQVPTLDHRSATTNEWNDELRMQLPTYYGLCKLEMYDIVGTPSDLSAPESITLAKCLAIPFVFTGLGHIFTPTGLKVWTAIASMYFSFCLVALGVWTPDACDSYNIKGLVEGGTTNTASRTGYSLAIYAERTNAGSSRSLSDGSQQDYANAIASVVSLRAILLQIVPQLTVVSVFASNTATCPLLVLRPQAASDFSLDACLPPLLVSEAFEIARQRGNPSVTPPATPTTPNPVPVPGDTSWTVYPLAAYIFFAESRLIQYVLRVYLFAMSVGILYSPSYYWMLSATCILLPYVFFQSLIFVVYLGRGMGIKDADLWSTSAMMGGYSSTATEIQMVADDNLHQTHLDDVPAAVSTI